MKPQIERIRSLKSSCLTVISIRSSRHEPSNDRREMASVCLQLRASGATLREVHGISSLQILRSIFVNFFYAFKEIGDLTDNRGSFHFWPADRHELLTNWTSSIFPRLVHNRNLKNIFDACFSFQRSAMLKTCKYQLV